MACLLPEGGVGSDRPVHAHRASARVFTIDTGVLFPETYEVWRQIENRYGLRIEVTDAGLERGRLERLELLRGTQGRGARASVGRR